MIENFSELDINYNTALFLALSLGFNDVCEIDNTFIFSCKQVLPTLVVNSTKVVEKVDNREYITINENSKTVLIEPKSTQKLKTISINTEMDYNDNSKLVPIDLRLPTPETKTKAGILKAFKDFFTQIIYITTKGNVPDCNKLNLKRLHHIAKSYLTSQNGYVGKIYLPIMNAFSGVKYNGKIYYGAIRTIQLLNSNKNEVDSNLSTLLINSVKEIYFNSQLKNMFQMDFSNETSVLIEKLRAVELPSKTEELNSLMPDNSTVFGKIKQGIVKLTDFIFEENPKITKKR